MRWEDALKSCNPRTSNDRSRWARFGSYVRATATRSLQLLPNRSRNWAETPEQRCHLYRGCPPRAL